MAAGFISFQTKNGNKFARFCVVKYKNERKYNEEKSLGRVIDDGKGIFKNRERSLFSFPVGNCYDLALKEIACTSAKIASGTMKMVLDFGDSFFLHTYLQTPPYWDVFKRVTEKKDRDTVLSLLSGTPFSTEEPDVMPRSGVKATIQHWKVQESSQNTWCKLGKELVGITENGMNPLTKED